MRGKDREHYANKIVKHRLRKIYATILVLVILVAVAAILWIGQKNRIYTMTELLSSHPRQTSSSAKTLMLGDCILTYSNDGASCSDTKGKAIWNQTYEMQNPIVAICENAVAIGDYNGRQIYIMNTEKCLSTISTNLPIRDLSVATNGVVAAVLDDSDVTWVHVYNSKGEAPVTFRTTMSQSGYPVDVDISPNSMLAAVSYLAPQDGSMKSSVAFYNFGEVGQNELDNYMSGYDYQTIVPHVEFMSSELAYALADDRLMFYEGAQKPVSKAEVLLQEEVQAVYHNEKYVGLVTYDTTGSSKYMLHIYDSQGTNVLNQGFDMDYKNIVLSGENIYIYGEAECSIYNTFGIQKYAGTMEKSINMIIPGTQVDKLTLVSNDVIQNLQLK